MIRHAARGFVNAAILLVLLLIGAFVLAQTGPGKRFLATRLSDQFSTPGTEVEIFGIGGWLPFDMRLDRLRIADADGVWLEANDVEVDWTPSALLQGRLQIETVGVARIEMVRPPLTPERRVSEPFRLPALPTVLPPITIERLTVPEIMVGAELVGEEASFELEGSLTSAADGRTVDLGLDLRRTDRPSAFATLISTLTLDPPALALDLDAGETGGLLAKITARQEAGELALSLTGEGPLDAWSGRLVIDADGLARAEADLTLTLDAKPRIGIDGTLSPAPTLLPDEARRLIGERIDLGLDMSQSRAQTLDVDRFRLETRNARLTGQGTVDFDRGDLDLSVALDTPDLSALSAYAGHALAGEAGATLDVGGSLRQPRGRLDLRLLGLGFDDVRIDDVTTGIDWGTNAPLDDQNVGFQISVTGDAEGVTRPDTPLPASDLAWRARLMVPREGRIDIREAAIEMAGARLLAEGGVDPATLESDVAVRFETASLGPLVAPLGQRIDGKARITAMIRSTRGAGEVTVDLQGDVEQLDHPPSAATDLIGDTIALAAAIDLRQRRWLAVRDLVIAGKDARLSGGFDLDLVNEGLAGDLALDLSRLSPLGPLIDQTIEGAVDLGLRLGGSLSAPTIDLDLAGKEMTVAGQPIDRLHLAVAGRDLLRSPTGDLDLDLTVRDVDLTLGLDYRLDDETLRLPRIDVTGAETSLGGALVVDIGTGLIDGTLDGGIDDLSTLAAVLESPLRGRADLKVELTPAGRRQDIALSILGESLGGDFGRIERLRLDAGLSDALGEPDLDATSAITGFEQGTVRLDSIALGVKGKPDRLALDLTLAGRAALQPLTLRSQGALALGDGITLTLDRLTGAFAGEPLRLASPITLRRGHDSLQLAGLDLRMGEARAQADVEITSKAVAGEIRLRALPMSWSEPFGGPAIDGSADADLTLAGTAVRPRLDAVVDLQNIRAGKTASSDLPPVDVAIRARLADGRLDTDLTASGLTRQPITANAGLPVDLRLQPFAFDLSGQAPLQGKVRAEVLLDRVGDLLALDEQILEGRLSVDLALAGTLAQPTINGPIDLENGAYENALSGTALHDITMQATASSERIAVDRLTSRVGEKGTVSGVGWLGLDGDAGFPLSATLAVQRAELISRDDVEATISGEIAMTGSLTDALVKGRLTVDRAEISIPDGGGPDLPTIEVEEVGGHYIAPTIETADQERAFDPSLDVTIDLPKKIYVRGRGLESEWQGKLAITGRAGDPLITGDLNVKKGYFDFIDKRFELREGTIAFGGSSPPNPILALEAAAGDDAFTAVIKLDGPATDPKLTMTSEPQLPEDEVLARLLFNRELSEIGPVEAAKLVLAVNRLRGGGGFDAFGEIRDALKVDTLDVVGGETSADSKIRAGKYLSDDIYLEVEKGTADQSGRARVEVEILPNVSLQADTGEDSTGGVGFKWRFDY